MRRRGAVIALLAVLAVGATARADSWVTVKPESRMGLSVRALGATQAGRFETWTADVTLDPARPEEARVNIDVQAASLRMNNASLTARTVGPAFLDATRHPVIRFRMTSLESLGAGRFTAGADVVVKGRTQAVRFPATLRVTGDTAQMTGGFSLDRTALGIGTSGPWNAVIGRQVRVDVVLVTRATR